LVKLREKEGEKPGGREPKLTSEKGVLLTWYSFFDPEEKTLSGGTQNSTRKF
jgi:hypothetical protein